jgi:Ulp1 family protease
MHEANLAVLRRNEFDIVVERFGIPVSQHDMLTLTDTNWLNDHIIGMQHTDFFTPLSDHGRMNYKDTKPYMSAFL